LGRRNIITAAEKWPSALTRIHRLSVGQAMAVFSMAMGLIPQLCKLTDQAFPSGSLDLSGFE
jgi:hypothetical protein